ncbi:MAG: HupE/UreJ family protein [Verrucomicrobia bacterium]|nr:HupE/UreJ family protein [Verrucomicrobiota bacterium]
MKTTIDHLTATSKLLVLALCLSVPSMAHAHISPNHANNVLGGLSHPLLGLDHILAMVAVGLWAAQLGGRAIWLVPATFVSLMTVGGLLGISGFALPFVAEGILISVLMLGVLIATAARLPLAVSIVVVGLFAIFHGHAHGTAMQVGVSGISYGLGFVLTTIALHACGIGLGRMAQQQSKVPLLRFAGAAIALAGLSLWLA